jgi:hypothetical protein
METLAHTPTDTATDATERDAILAAVRKWINQRPGLDADNYGRDPAGKEAYWADAAGIKQAGDDARRMLRAVELRPSITAAMLRDAFQSAFSGRLSWDGARLDYTTGQYWPTEYRRAAAAVLASALWAYWRDHCMPATPAGYAVIGWGNRRDWYAHYGYATRAEAEAALVEAGGHAYGHIVELYLATWTGTKYLSAGDFIRQTARRELGAPIARRWFN